MMVGECSSSLLSPPELLEVVVEVEQRDPMQLEDLLEVQVAQKEEEE